MEYLFVFAILFIGFIRFDVLKQKDRNNSWLFWELLCVISLAGLRYKVGGDTQSYIYSFENFPTLFQLDSYYINDSRTNVLWIYFFSLCKTIVDDFLLFQILHAVIVNTAFFYFFKKYTNRYFSVILVFYLLYFFKYNTEVLRASFSVCIFLWSYKYLIIKKWFLYFVMTIIAIGFHSEALIMLFFPIIHLMKNIKISTFTCFLILLLSAIILFSMNLLPFMHSLANVSGSEKVMESVEVYAGGSEMGKGVSILGYIKTFLINSILLLVSYQLRASKYVYFRSFLIISFFFSILNLNYSNIFFRFMDFLNPIVIVCLINAYEESHRQNNKFAKYIICFYIIYLIGGYFIGLADGHWILFFPYSSVFSPVEYSMREIYFYELFEH